MRCRLKNILVLVVLALLSSCQEGLHQSSVPNAPVQITINTYTGIYTHFKPDNIGAYMTIDQNGFYLNGKWAANLTNGDYYGYRGLAVVVDMNSQHSAFDLCCPHCNYYPDGVVGLDGFAATCQHCGEVYDLTFGYAIPQKGISKEPLKKYKTRFDGSNLIIYN